MEESSQHDDNTDLLEKLELKKEETEFSALEEFENDEMEPAKSSATPFVVGSDISEKVKEKSKKKKVKKPIATGKPVKGEDDISSKLSAAPFVSSDVPVANPEPQPGEQPERPQENPQHYERVLREVETLHLEVETLRRAVGETDANVDGMRNELRQEVETLRRAVGETDANVDGMRNELRQGLGAIMARLGVPQSNNIRNPSGQPPSDDIGRREQGQPSPRSEDEDN